jgi:hypothetical protein
VCLPVPHSAAREPGRRSTAATSARWAVGGGAFDPCPALPLARRARPTSCRVCPLPSRGWAAPDLPLPCREKENTCSTQAQLELVLFWPVSFRLPALMDLYIHPLYVLVSKILSSILNSPALIHSLYHPLSTVGPTCHFM